MPRLKRKRTRAANGRFAKKPAVDRIADPLGIVLRLIGLEGRVIVFGGSIRIEFGIGSAMAMAETCRSWRELCVEFIRATLSPCLPLTDTGVPPPLLVRLAGETSHAGLCCSARLVLDSESGQQTYTRNYSEDSPVDFFGDPLDRLSVSDLREEDVAWVRSGSGLNPRRILRCNLPYHGWLYRNVAVNPMVMALLFAELHYLLVVRLTVLMHYHPHSSDVHVGSFLSPQGPVSYLNCILDRALYEFRKRAQNNDVDLGDCPVVRVSCVSDLEGDVDTVNPGEFGLDLYDPVEGAFRQFDRLGYGNLAWYHRLLTILRVCSVDVQTAANRVRSGLPVVRTDQGQEVRLPVGTFWDEKYFAYGRVGTEWEVELRRLAMFGAPTIVFPVNVDYPVEPDDDVIGNFSGFRGRWFGRLLETNSSMHQRTLFVFNRPALNLPEVTKQMFESPRIYNWKQSHLYLDELGLMYLHDAATARDVEELLHTIFDRGVDSPSEAFRIRRRGARRMRLVLYFPRERSGSLNCLELTPGKRSFNREGEETRFHFSVCEEGYEVGKSDFFLRIEIRFGRLCCNLKPEAPYGWSGPAGAGEVNEEEDDEEEDDEEEEDEEEDDEE